MIHVAETIIALFTRFLAAFGQVAPSVQLADVGGGASGTGGAVGHLVAAAMETAGVFAQAEVLATFSNGLEHLAALCYVCSIAGGLLTAAMFGHYRQAAYLLIGPPLFFFTITTTHNVAGTEVINGDRVTPGSVGDQINFLKKYVTDAKLENGAEVSFLFWGIDRVVSSVVQGVVSVIIDTKNNDDILFKMRERVLSWTLLSMPNNPGFAKLISMAAIGECAEVSRMTFEMLKHRTDPTLRSIDANNLDQTGQDLKAKYERDKAKPRFLLDHEISTLLSADPKTQQQYEQNRVSCEQVWAYLHQTATDFAAKKLDINSYIGSGDKDPNVPWDRVQQDVNAAFGDGVAAREVLAAYLVKNTMARTTHANMTTEIFNRVPFNAERSAGVFEDAVDIHRYGGYLRIQYLARSIPYIQGILLYILAATFPFFAVFLVMPSRASTFLIWLSLWIWVKSWDIGFALVDVARSILWLFTSAAVNKFAAQNAPKANMAASQLDWTRPETIFALIADNDPLANQNTYFTIIGIMVAAVPLITAHFCLGAGQLWSVFSGNLNQRGDYNWSRRMKQLGRGPASAAEISAAEYSGNSGISGANQARAQMKTGGGAPARPQLPSGSRGRTR